MPESAYRWHKDTINQPAMSLFPGQEAFTIEELIIHRPYQSNEWTKEMIKRLILASQSPRRRELLNMFSIGCLEIIPADIKEESSPTLPVGEAAAQIALSKAISVAEKVGDRDLILAADTLVSLDNHILGKPVDAADAARMLGMLSLRTHVVCTGIALIQNGRQLCRYETTFVTFKQLTKAEIWAYIASGEPMDKAGAYGAQGLASLFITRIEGDFFNIVGLPLCLLGSMLDEMGYSLF